MSYTKLYLVPKKGPVEEHAAFQNAWGSACRIWAAVGHRYFGWLETPPMMNNEAMELMWKFPFDLDYPYEDRIVVASTFDRAMVQREHLQTLALAYRNFERRFPPGKSVSHLPAQADCFEKLAEDKRCFGVCWTQTTVVQGHWIVQRDGEPPRGYDLSLDNDHQFIFNDVPKDGTKLLKREEALAICRAILAAEAKDDVDCIWQAFKQLFAVGQMAERVVDGAEFTMGIEYGIVVGLARAFGMRPSELGTPQTP